MKFGFAVCALSMVGVIVAQACGSDDGNKKSDGPDYSAGGDGAAGAPASSTSGNGGTGGSVSDAGAPTTGATAGMPNGADGGAGAAAPSGSAGEGAQGGLGGQGGGAGSAAAGETGAGGAGEAITCELAATCTGDLSNLGTDDFSIALTLTTETMVRSGVISQRAICMHSKFWDVRMGPTDSGWQLSIELDDQTNYTSFSVPAAVNDGEPHDVRFCRKSGQVHAFVDGVLVGSNEDKTSFTTLTTLATKTTTCMSYDGTTTLDGTVADVCVGAL